MEKVLPCPFCGRQAGGKTTKKSQFKGVIQMAEQYDLFGGCQEIPTKPKPKNYKQKRNWENRFQRWSDKMAVESTDVYGKCGYGLMCDYCSDNNKGRPCVRALNEYLRNMDKKINYEKATFEDVWNGRF